MTSFKLFVSSIALFILIHGCGEILEPVALMGGKQDEKNGGFQEEFDIEIKSLTFSSARDANNSPYQRRVMRSGVGAAANVIDEEELLTSNLPFSSKHTAYLLGNGDKLQYNQSLKFVESDVQFPTQPLEKDYLLGFGDRVEYTQLLKFVESDIRFPVQPVKEDYLLGVGDELTLLQLNEPTGGTRNIIASTPKKDDEQNTSELKLSQSVLRTSSTVGTDGNILLLDLGSIRAANRSLKNVQTEVRNILIRNGLAPNFQLEITGFNSRKAFVTFPAEGDTFGKNIVPLTNLPITLKELVINYGLRPSSDDATVVSLNRNGQKFRMTAGQMFKKSSPRVVIKDGDQIEIDEIEGVTEPTEVVVGSRGHILIPGAGRIKAKNRSLSEVQTDITRKLTKKGLVPNFQLEITGFNSRKAFVTFPAEGDTFGKNIVPLTNLPVTLKELVINYGLRPSSDDATVVSLTRNGQKFRMTAGQIFKKSSPRVVIKDGDQIEIDEIEGVTEPTEVVVGSRGHILIPGVGRIKAKNRSLSEVQTDITRKLTKKGLVPNFQLEITGFNSKKFFFITEKYGSKAIPFTNAKLDLKAVILSNNSFNLDDEPVGSNQKLKIVEITRKGLSYRMTLRNVLNNKAGKIFIQDDDTIELQEFSYKPGQVFALSGAGNAKAVPISPSNRETLADILFTEDGVLSNNSAKRSEVYLLRGRAPSVAYHLDAQNVSRILVAAETELRPNDIVFVADRPMISFTRALRELSPLRMLLRDIRLDNLP